MQCAIQEAITAETFGEIPIGAVVVCNNQLIAKSYNSPISCCDPTAHAEIRVLQQAAKIIGNYRLVNCELYCTIEPCTMCAGAIIHSRIKRLIFGATEPKAGAIISNLNIFEQPQVNHKPEVSHGILHNQCKKIVSTFFQKRRLEAKNGKK
jgi:tRNA(adenine34) deaminase